jgi:hypothetical protein
MDEKSLKPRGIVAPITSAPKYRTPPGPQPIPTAEARAPEPKPEENNVLPLEPGRMRATTRRRRKDAPKVPIEEHIGRQLRSIYDDVLSQPVPDRFLELLKQLETQPPKKDGEA